MPDGTTSSAPPRPCCRIDAASWISTAVTPDAERVIDRAGQRRHQVRAVGNQPADALVDDLDLIAFEHRDVHELAERLRCDA